MGLARIDERNIFEAKQAKILFWQGVSNSGISKEYQLEPYFLREKFNFVPKRV